MGRMRKPQLQRKATHSAAAERSANSHSTADVSLTLDSNTAQRKQQDNISAMQQGSFSVAQREKAEALGAAIAQRAEDEELMQGKMDIAQRVEEEELMQGKMDPALQRVEDEELMQGKAQDTSQLQEQAAPNQTGMPDNLKAGIESMSGMSMDAVKVHYNSDKPAQMNAHAYAQGTDIHVASGQEKHLPHEAWHVVQQAQGKVKPTMQMASGAQINDDPALEKEADVMGAKATQFKPKPNNVTSGSNSGNT